MKPIVLVISGISGSGKSTLAFRVHDWLKASHQLVRIMDGDETRSFFDGALAYSPEDRLMVSKILAFGAACLHQQGVHVILATMLSQPGARAFLRSKVDFLEVFLDPDLEAVVEHDVKGVYQDNLSKKEPQLVGHDLTFSKPEQPDLVIHTHQETVEQSFNKIIDFLKAHLHGS